MRLQKRYPSYVTLPVLIIYVMFLLVPGFIGIGYSFTDWNAYSSDVLFVGLDNYKKLFTGSNYFTNIGNTLLFTLGSTICKLIAALLLALLFTNKKVWLRNIQRTIIFSPQVLSFLIIGLVFRGLLHPSTGFLNIFLRSIGLDSLAQKWLTDVRFAFPSVIAVDMWRGMGHGMVVFITAIQSVPASCYEAAEIDGASYWQRVFKVVLPMIRPSILVITVLNITYGLRVFDIIFVLTNGGPGHVTSVINTAVYREFAMGNYAMGSTLSSVLFVIVMIISVFASRLMSRQEVET